MQEGRRYTIADIQALPDGQRAELIDGEMYMLDAPATDHQSVITELIFRISRHIELHGERRRVFTDLSVFLNNDDYSYLLPDVVVCDPDKLDENGCHGAPDWVIEIISPSSFMMDHHKKFRLYEKAGVREYWIIDPRAFSITKYDFSNDLNSVSFPFTEKVMSEVMQGLTIDLSNLPKYD